MSKLTSQQRKWIYVGGIVLLLVPIIWLGSPSTGKEGSGGVLAKLRQPPPVGYDLGETTIGDVDPTSSAMNLVLLGLRGVATNLLWMDAIEHQKTKNFGQLRADVESIILLQPHFLAVWDHHGWNLAYNVSAEWDGVADRYYWVKEGGKFLMRGSARNQRYPELYWKTGRIMGPKIGQSDEWRQFREFFRKDPNEKEFKGRPDPGVNPNDKDNYIVAHDWYSQSNDVEDTQEQHVMSRILFRQQKSQSLIDFADVQHREGIFDEVASRAWQDARDVFIGEYGQEEYQTPGGRIIQEATPQSTLRLAEEQGVSPKLIAYWTVRYQNVSNYRTWRTRLISESVPATGQGHRALYHGRELFKEGKFAEAQASLERGMAIYEKLLQRFPSLLSDDATIDEVLGSVLYWRYVFELREAPIPNNYPLKEWWEKEQGRLVRLDQNFRRELGLN